MVAGSDPPTAGRFPHLETLWPQPLSWKVVYIVISLIKEGKEIRFAYTLTSAFPLTVSAFALITPHSLDLNVFVVRRNKFAKRGTTKRNCPDWVLSVHKFHQEVWRSSRDLYEDSFVHKCGTADVVFNKKANPPPPSFLSSSISSHVCSFSFHIPIAYKERFFFKV